MGPAFSEGTVNALSGGVAGAANTFTGFPFDTVKVRLQASPPGTYAGPWDCARSIVKYEGVRGASEHSPKSLWQCEDCQTHSLLQLFKLFICWIRFVVYTEVLQPRWWVEPWKLASATQ